MKAVRPFEAYAQRSKGILWLSFHQSSYKSSLDSREEKRLPPLDRTNGKEPVAIFNLSNGYKCLLSDWLHKYCIWIFYVLYYIKVMFMLSSYRNRFFIFLCTYRQMYSYFWLLKLFVRMYQVGFQILLIFSSLKGSIMLDEIIWIPKILNTYIHASEQKLIPWQISNLGEGCYCPFMVPVPH